MSELPSTSCGPVNIEFITTKRGCHMLCRNGYNYIWEQTNNDGSEVWRCTKKDFYKCNAIAKVYPSPLQILHETTHNHSPKEQTMIEIEQQMHLCSETIKNNINTPVKKIFEESIEVLANRDINLLSSLPQVNNVKTKLYKQRSKTLAAYKLNLNSTEFIVPKKYENLVFADYAYENKRIIILAKAEMTKYLKESKVFFVNSTFEICPKLFHQICTIHADIGSNQEYNNLVPVLYALLPDREQDTYHILFEMIKRQVPEWDPSHITMDFKMSAMLAIKQSFPEIKIGGCFIHFKRSLWCKAAQLGITKSTFSKVFVGLCSVLWYLPLNRLADGWLYVMGETPNTDAFKNFKDFFVQTWLQHPLLANTWDCNIEIHRNFNVVGSWNARIKKIIPLKPNITQFLNGVRKDSTFYHKKTQQSNYFRISKRNKESIKLNEIIDHTIQQLLGGRISVGHCLEKIRNILYI